MRPATRNSTVASRNIQSAKSVLPSTRLRIIFSPRKSTMATHTTIVIELRPNATQETRNMVNIHGPSFRVPVLKSLAFIGNRSVLPVCGVRDNWVGWLFEDEISY